MAATKRAVLAQLEHDREDRQIQTGLAIRSARAGLTQAELGELLLPYLGEAVPQTTISRWEKGTVSIDLEQLRAIELALELRPGTLFAAAGYVPVSAPRRHASPDDVIQFLQTDPNIDESIRESTVNVYKSLLRTTKNLRAVRRLRAV